MSAELIRYVGLGITMLVVNLMVERLHRQGNVGEGTDTRYVVEAPGLLKSVYMTMFLFGLFLYFFFLFHYSQGNPTVSKGHLWFALIFAGIGLMVRIVSGSWKMTVQDGMMTIYRLFGRTRTISVAGLDEVEAGSKGQLVLRSGGKKILTLDPALVNFGRLVGTLQEYGKL